MSIGKPALCANSIASCSPDTTPTLPGMTGTRACRMDFFAAALSPMRSIAAAEGPMNLRECASHASAKLGRSERNPMPGCMASAPVMRAALMMFSALR